jgi:hypothetical protein
MVYQNPSASTIRSPIPMNPNQSTRGMSSQSHQYHQAATGPSNAYTGMNPSVSSQQAGGSFPQNHNRNPVFSQPRNRHAIPSTKTSTSRAPAMKQENLNSSSNTHLSWYVNVIRISMSRTPIQLLQDDFVSLIFAS